MNLDKYFVVDNNGNEVRRNDVVHDFRGEPAIFRGVSRGPEYNGTAKVLTTHDPDADSFSERESYDSVFNLVVTPRD